jgi:hypothetical protein
MIRTAGRFVKTSSASVPAGKGTSFTRAVNLRCKLSARLKAVPFPVVASIESQNRLPAHLKIVGREVQPKKSGLEQSGKTTQAQRPQNYFCDAMASACSALRMRERVVSLMRRPCFGRRVKLGTRTTGCPGMVSSWNLWAMVARSKVASIMANDDPMHCLGPPPNGKYAKRGSFWEHPGSQRSGSNFSGSGK